MGQDDDGHRRIRLRAWLACVAGELKRYSDSIKLTLSLNIRILPPPGPSCKALKALCADSVSTAQISVYFGSRNGS